MPTPHFIDRKAQFDQAQKKLAPLIERLVNIRVNQLQHEKNRPENRAETALKEWESQKASLDIEYNETRLYQFDTGLLDLQVEANEINAIMAFVQKQIDKEAQALVTGRVKTGQAATALEQYYATHEAAEVKKPKAGKPATEKQSWLYTVPARTDQDDLEFGDGSNLPTTPETSGFANRIKKAIKRRLR